MRARRGVARATRLGLCVAVAGAAWAATAGGAGAAPLPVDLRDLPQQPLLFSGQGVNEGLGMPFGPPTGRSIETRCDLDGDGVDDLVAAGPGWTPGGGNGGHHGRVHVIRGGAHWGGGTPPAVPGAIAIEGRDAGEGFGADVVCAGDVDGDGIDDLAIGLGGGGVNESGIHAYLLPGAEDLIERGSFAVDAAPDRIVAVDNVDQGWTFATPTQWAPLGDLDGDGRAELALASAPTGLWVIPGRARGEISGNTIDLAQPGGGYLVADGISFDYDALEAVGDVDGDGVGDLAVGQYGSDGTGPNASGVVQVLSGAALDDPEAEPFDVTTEPAGERVLFRIQGPTEDARAGMAIAALGDANGDGRDDIAVGVPGSATDTGQVFVVNGRASHDQVDLPDLGAAGGYAISGLPGGADFGAVVEAAGDLDGDGLGDLLVGAPLHVNPLVAGIPSPNGAAYVVYGQTGSGPIDVAEPTPATGAVLSGQHFYSMVGANLASIADLDGNGLPELVVAGHPKAAPGKGELTILRLGEPLPEPPGPGPDPGPSPDPHHPGPAPVPKAPGVPAGPGSKPKLVSGDVTRRGRRGAVTVTLSRTLGAKPRRAYRVKLLRRGRTVASGRLRGRTLKLWVRRVGKGKRARYPRLSGAYTVAGAEGVRGVTRTKIRIG